MLKLALSSSRHTLGSSFLLHQDSFWLGLMSPSEKLRHSPQTHLGFENINETTRRSSQQVMMESRVGTVHSAFMLPLLLELQEEGVGSPALVSRRPLNVPIHFDLPVVQSQTCFQCGCVFKSFLLVLKSPVAFSSKTGARESFSSTNK